MPTRRPRKTLVDEQWAELIGLDDLAGSWMVSLARHCPSSGQDQHCPPLPPGGGEPLMDALRRIRQGSSSLPLGHRQALAACLGAEPPRHAFLRLGVEEARTHQWRRHDPRPLAKLAALLSEQNREADPPYAALVARAWAYLALFQARHAPTEAVPTLGRMLEWLERAGGVGDLPFLCALPIALQHGNEGRVDEAIQGLSLAHAWVEASLEHRRDPAILDVVLEVGLVLGWLCVAVGATRLAGDYAARMLQNYRPGCDPWLQLELCHDAAAAALRVGSGPENPLSLITFEDARTLGEAEQLDQAQDFLQKAAPLLADFSGPEGQKRHARLEAALLERRNKLACA